MTERERHSLKIKDKGKERHIQRVFFWQRKFDIVFPNKVSIESLFIRKDEKS